MLNHFKNLFKFIKSPPLIIKKKIRTLKSTPHTTSPRGGGRGGKWVGGGQLFRSLPCVNVKGVMEINVRKLRCA